MDADPDMLRIAARKAVLAHAPVRFVCGFLQDPVFRAESFNCVLSSLVFHHLDRASKLRALSELYLVLEPGGRIHIVDWGRPAGAVLQFSFFLVRVLDGFRVTRDNARGELPSLLIEAGFMSVEHRRRMNNFFGTLDFLSAAKNPEC